MSLPRLVEYMLSVRRPSGGVPCELSAFQGITATFPPATTIRVEITPPDNIYAIVMYHVGLSTEMVPHSFEGYVQQQGHGLYSGTFTQLIVGEGIDCFVIITHASPLIYGGTNVSGLVQYTEADYWYVSIYTQEDYAIIMRAFEDLRGQTAHNDAVVAINLMKAQRPYPQEAPL